MAFMAYVNSAARPTSVEFQYYRSVGTHTDAQQGDQVFIYKLTSDGTWTVTVRDAFTKIVAGTNMTSSYSSGTLTLNATGGGTADALPLAGGTMEGDIDMDGNAVTGLPTPAANSDAVPKSYADTKYSKPSGGIPQTDLASAVQSKLDSTVVVSDTQPTATENKLWVDTDAGSGSTYQVPTVAEMEAADAQIVNYTEYTLTKLSTATNWTIIRYHACKLGKIAFLQIVASVTTNQDSSGVRIFELPQELCPRYAYETRFTSAEFAMDVNVNITVEGNVAFTRGGSTAGNIRMDFCYPTN